jgi:hypothetical protein
MQELKSCTGCKRHIRARETTCPFCGVSREANAAVGAQLPTQRLGSAALFGFRAAALVTLVGCGAESDDSASTTKDNEKAPLATAHSPSSSTQAPPDEAPSTTPPSEPTLDLSPPTPDVSEPGPVETAADATDDVPDPDAGMPLPMDDIRNPVSVYRAPPSD